MTNAINNRLHFCCCCWWRRLALEMGFLRHFQLRYAVKAFIFEQKQIVLVNAYLMSSDASQTYIFIFIYINCYICIYVSLCMFIMDACMYCRFVSEYTASEISNFSEGLSGNLILNFRKYSEDL